jgi:hypothetical protein
MKTKNSVLDFSENSIFTSLHTGLNFFSKVAENANYRVFFVKRDPRDILVSWYFSMKCSHVLMGKVSDIRDKLNDLSISEGLIFCMHCLKEQGTFSDLESWISADERDPRIIIVKFEDLTSENNLLFFKEIFQHCHLDVKDHTLKQILSDYSFEKLARRSPGFEDQSSHFRKGIEGDWVNYFDDQVEQAFNQIVGESLPWNLGYQTSKEALLQKQLQRYQTLLENPQYVQVPNRNGENSQKIDGLKLQIRVNDLQLKLNSVQEKLSLTKQKLEKAQRRRKKTGRRLQASLEREKRKSRKIEALNSKILELQAKQSLTVRDVLSRLKSRLKKIWIFK